jgi:hypothetical protein
VQISNILNGWQNFIAKSEVSEKLAKERAAECAKCTHAKEGKILAFIKDDLKEIEGYYCDLCKCPLSAKVRSQNENCEDKLW